MTEPNPTTHLHLEYNSEREHLRIPEYGRHLQKLIDLACEIPTKEERNKAAKHIINVMGTLNPHLRDVPDFQHKLWDQIFIMSDFKLDVDSPYPIPTKELLHLKPDPLPYPQKNPKYRFYGNHIKSMIDVANSWEAGELKDILIKVIANHMKKSYLSWNKDVVEDTVIFDHLLELSSGKINLHTSQQELSTTSTLMRTNKKVSNKTFNGNNQQNNPVKNNRSNFKNKNKNFHKKNKPNQNNL
jgi:hypothetical protein